MVAILPSKYLFLKHHLVTSTTFVPTQSSPVSVDHPLDVNKPASSGGKKKKMTKRKTSHSKSPIKKRYESNGSSRNESHIDIPTDSDQPITPPGHSFEVPFIVSIPLAHTHEEYPQNPPSSSQKDDVSIEQSSLHPLEQTHMSFRKSHFILHKHDMRPLPRIL